MSISDIFGAAAGLAGGGSAVGGLGAAAGLASGVGALGVGLEAFGAIEKYEGAQKQAAAQNAIIGDEEKQDNVRRQAMEVSARRQQMEVFRNSQRARALALNNATSEGAQFGSGLQGGYGQVAGQSGVNMLGINQNLQAGNQMFDLSKMINDQKINITGAQSQQNAGSGLMSLGGAALTSMGPIKSLSGNLFGSVGSGGGMGASGSFGGGLGLGG